MYDNPLLDRLPEDYEGYLIRTDYRIGIQIIKALSDPDYDEYEQTAVACHLLFGKGTPPLNIAIKGINWFLQGGIKTSNPTGESGKKCFDYDFDSERICTAFKRTYGIDINRSEMHWFEFCWCLADMGDVALTQVIDFRNANTEKMEKSQRAAYQKMKRIYAVPEVVSEEQQDYIQNRLDELNGKSGG